MTMRNFAVLLALLLAIPLSASGAMAQQNPFGVGKSNDAPAASAPEATRAPNRFGPPVATAAPDGEPTGAPMITLPAPLRTMFRQIATWQKDLNRFLSGRLRESGKDGGIVAAATVLLVSFLYGVLHAAGPGHGKMVVASYFTARRAPLRTGILMGSVIALTQAVVAILMVWVMAIVLGGSQMQILERTNLLELVSYGIICAIGLYMTYTALKGQDSCGHDHGPAASTFDEPAHDHQAHGHQTHEHQAHAHHDHAHHDHDGDHHDHDHHEHHDHGHAQHNHARHDHGGAAVDPRDTWIAKTARRVLGRDGEVIVVGVVSGVRPCSGSILVLLFALANGVFLLGIAAAFSIAFGVAITISALGIGAIMLRRAVSGGETPATPTRAFFNRALAIGGSLAVVLMGGLLFGGTLAQTGVI